MRGPEGGHDRWPVRLSGLAFLRELAYLWLLFSGYLGEPVSGWTGLDPVAGQEDFEILGRWVAHELFEDRLEVGKGVYLVV